MLKRQKCAERIVMCINDPCDLEYTIKDSECTLRQNSKPINNVFMNSGNSFPSFKGVHAVLDSPGDKIHLQAFLETEFENIVSATALKSSTV